MKLITMITKKNIVYNKYKDYSVEELIQDEYFIRSMTNPTQESDAFWKKAVKERIISPENYQLACHIFDTLQVHSESISNAEISSLWNDIKTVNNNNGKQEKDNHLFLWTISSVAFLTLLFVITIKFISDISQKDESALIENAAKPIEQIDDIQLILADNEAIALDGEEADIKYNGENIAINNNGRKLNKTHKPESTVYNQLVVPKGKRSTLTLEDGSKVWINAGTRVVYPVVFAANEREIYVDGEVFLDVSHEEGRPFIVKSQDFNVEVLGTSFNFMAYESDNTHHIVLVSGSVKVKSKNDMETMLSPNEMFLYENNTSHIQKVNVNDYISWKTGMYQYQSERLDIIMKRLSRYYGEEIDCRPEVAHLRCSGKLDLKDNLDTVLKGISQTAPVSYQIENGVYMIIYE